MHLKHRRGLTPCFVLFAAALFGSQTAQAQAVDESEVVAVAQFWLTREFDARQPHTSESIRRERVEQLKEVAIAYLDARGEWHDRRPSDVRVLGYVVQFRTGGFVALSADERLEPVIGFDSHSLFRTEPADGNFLRQALQRSLFHRWRWLGAQLQAGSSPSEHVRWAQLRLEMEQPSTTMQGLIGNEIHVEWSTPLWNQPFPYNTECAARNGNQDVPTGCVATAIAVKLRFHRWPYSGSGVHGYDDDLGLVQHHHFVDYGAATYDWNSMPFEDITSPNAAIAQLMYHCGVAVDMNYETDESGAWPNPAVIDTLFRYWGTVQLVSNHEPNLAASVIAGLPVLVVSSTHMVVVDGYRNDAPGWFHVNAGWGGTSNGWLDLNQIPGGDPTIDRSYPFQSPANYRYVDRAWQGVETGHVLSPYDTLAEGLAQTPVGGALWLKSTTFAAAPSVLDKPMTIHSYSGSTILDR